MTPVEAALRDRIALEGPISIAAFMDLVLNHPTAGYYQQSEAIGAPGDFVTAPEISQMFGELLGLWSAVLWQQLGRPQACQWIELGPGRGSLMADALRAARQVPGFLAATRLHLVEANAAQRALQQKVITHEAVHWHDTLATVPQGPLVLIANEFFDALPVFQFERLAEGWAERRIACDSSGLKFVATPVTPPADMPDLAVGSVVETCPAAQALVSDIVQRITRYGGGALLIDYGYLQAPRTSTLQAVRRHRYHPVLEQPGTADVTAHVDFPSLIRAAHRAGGKVAGPISQSRFLRAMGIDLRHQALRRAADPAQAERLDRALNRLTDAAAMGRLFQCLAIVSQTAGVPPGFEPASDKSKEADA